MAPESGHHLRHSQSHLPHYITISSSFIDAFLPSSPHSTSIRLALRRLCYRRCLIVGMFLAVLFIKSDLRLVVDLQTCIKAQQSRAYAQKVKISNLQQMAKTVAYIQEHGYDTQKKLQDTTDTIQSKMEKVRSDAKLTEAKLKKVNE